MVTLVRSCTLDGIDAVSVDVECEIQRGLPHYNVVGLAATSVKEGAVRIRSALESVGTDLPLKKVTINLAPADLRKPGCALDLPIALAVLVANGGLPDPVADLIVLGELGLDGGVRPVRGVLSAAMLAKERGFRGVLVPAANVGEASAVDDIEVYGVTHLREVTEALAGRAILPTPSKPRRTRARRRVVDMSEVRGQHYARAALELAVAGGHNILFAGPPGTGKTMLARRIPTILPPLTRAEALETTKIYSSLGLATGLIEDRPFRAPHHTISSAALLGGGSNPRPGEISLAHNGVLFLDELPEFSRGSIEGLREPLEEREVTISRVHASLRLPASFLLAAAANPCPCGWADSRVRECKCTTEGRSRYEQRLSGPLLDRIDLQTFVSPVSLAELRSETPGEPSERIRERVIAARDRQRVRLAPFGLHCNAEMTTTVLRATCRLDAETEARLATLVAEKRTFTARSIDRLLKVARTAADLAGRDDITRDDLEYAASHRDVDPLARVLPQQPKGTIRRRGKRPDELAPAEDPVLAAYRADSEANDDNVIAADHEADVMVADRDADVIIDDHDADLLVGDIDVDCSTDSTAP